MKNFAWKIGLCLLAGVALAGCVDLDVQGRGHVGAPPDVRTGQNNGEHGEDGDREKHRHKHKHKDDKDDNEGDDDEDGDEHRGRHRKD